MQPCVSKRRYTSKVQCPNPLGKRAMGTCAHTHTHRTRRRRVLTHTRTVSKHSALTGLRGAAKPKPEGAAYAAGHDAAAAVAVATTLRAAVSGGNTCSRMQSTTTGGAPVCSETKNSHAQVHVLRNIHYTYTQPCALTLTSSLPTLNTAPHVHPRPASSLIYLPCTPWWRAATSRAWDDTASRLLPPSPFVAVG